MKKILLNTIHITIFVTHLLICFFASIFSIIANKAVGVIILYCLLSNTVGRTFGPVFVIGWKLSIEYIIVALIMLTFPKIIILLSGTIERYFSKIKHRIID